MNSITITETSVIPFSKEHQFPYMERENNHGKFVQFRVVEKRYKKRDNVWLMSCEGDVMNQFLALNVRIGSNLFIIGEEETYMDMALRKESKYVKVHNVKYGNIHVPDNKGHSSAEVPMDVPQEKEINEDEIFIKKIDLE